MKFWRVTSTNIILGADAYITVIGYSYGKKIGIISVTGKFRVISIFRAYLKFGWRCIQLWWSSRKLEEIEVIGEIRRD